MRGRGRFITVEGIEGVGKSTQVPALVEAVEARGHRVEATREPGGTALADRIRGVLLDAQGDAPSPTTELLMLFAARAEHVESRIRPSLEAGTWVVCDRFTDATYAYQGGGRGVPLERIAALEQWVLGELRPDRTLLLDAPPDVALERARARGASDRFERETLAFFERVRARYLERARAEPERFRVIDASGELASVRTAVQAAVKDLG
jgi:dTMP kinase